MTGALESTGTSTQELRAAKAPVDLSSRALCAVQAPTCGEAVKLGFEDSFFYSAMKPKIDSTNTGELGTTITIPSPHLQILQLHLLVVQLKNYHPLLICAL